MLKMTGFHFHDKEIVRTTSTEFDVTAPLGDKIMHDSINLEILMMLAYCFMK